MLTLRLFMMVLLTSEVLLSQSALTLSSATASGGSASLVLTLTSTGNQPAALQWTTQYSSSDIQSITAIAGAAATAAGKTITCANTGAAYKCILAGLNANTIQNGVVAVINLTLSPSASSTVTLGITETLAASPDGQALALTGTGGSVTSAVVPNVTGLTCAPSSLSSGMASTCTVTLSRTGGGAVALSSNSALATVPASVSVAAGATTATFTATAGVISSDQTATITGSLNGSSRSTQISLTSPPAISSVACAPATLGAAGTSACAVTLTNTIGGTVSLSSNNGLLTVPASVSVATGNTTTTFSVTAGTIPSDQNATITAALNGSSKSASVALTTALTINGLSCTAATLTSSSSTTCTVTLSKTAGGAVALSSSSASVTVPASVVVPAGSVSATFTATVGVLATDQAVSISATVNGVSRSASLSLVGPLTVSALTCSPTSVAPSQSTTCTLTMSKAGGGTIALSSSTASVTVPASVSVAADGTTATFTATVATNATDQAAMIVASFNGSSRSTSLAITGIVTISSLTCGPVSAIGSSGSATCVITLSKTGGGAVMLTSNHPSVTLPVVVLVSPSATSATFLATVSGVTSDQSATITATLNGASKSATLSLNSPIIITSLACAPSTLTAAGSSTCTVTLSRTGGGTVAISSNSGLLSVPASLLIGPGATSATFTAIAGSVISAEQTAAITASLNGSSQTASLLLTPKIFITSLTCSSTALQTGDRATCTVTLSKSAGGSVKLSTSSTLLSAPTSAEVGSGATTASFVVTAGTITADEKATLSASLNGSSLSVAIDLATAARVTSFSCTPATLAQEGSASCAVTLSSAAGGTVSLSTENISLSVTGSVTVPAGMTIRTVSVKAGAITSNQTATIKATLGESWQAAVVNLTTAPGVQSVSCTPSALVAGSSSTCTVSMAHTQGAMVTLASSNAAVSVPASVLVYAGTATANFTVTAAGKVDPNDTAIVTASVNGVGGSASLALLASNSISSLSCYPDETTAGTLMCAVQLILAAPPGGTSVKVQTTGSRLSPPAEVMIPEGQQGISFAIRVTPSDMDEQPLITASIPGAVQTTSLPIVGIRPTIVRFTGNVARAGNWIDAEIQLNRTNVPEVARLTLTSSVPEIRLPRSITTRPGQTRVAFKAYVDPTAKQQTAEITIQFGQTVLRSSLPIEPGHAPILNLPGEMATRFDEPVSFMVSASDPDGLPLVYAVEGLPSGANFDAESGAFSWTPGQNQQGKYEVVLTATNTAQAVTSGRVVINVDAGQPVATVLRNAATSIGPACSPGALASLEGRWLGSDRNGVSDPSGSATSLNGAAVKVNEEYVPVVFSSWNRVTFVCPAAEPGRTLNVVVETQAGTSETLTGSSAAIAPGLFTIDESGAAQGLAYLSGTSLLATSRDYRGLGQPAQFGDSITVQATGFGEGSVPIVTVGGLVARVDSVQRTPGAAGVVEITVTVPPGVPEGDRIPVLVTFPLSDAESASGSDGVRSNVVTIAIEPAKE